MVVNLNLRGELVRAAADGLVERAEAFAFETRRETFVDAAYDARALVHEARVELHERRARANLLPGVLRVEDAADADNLGRAARQASERGDDLRRARAKRRAAQAARAEGLDARVR